MSNTTRTPVGTEVQLGAFFGLPYTVTPFSTLNEKFNFATAETLAIGETPLARYIGIGNGGHDVEVVGGVAAISGVNRVSNAAALYSHMPFVMRPVTNDLTPAEKAKLRGRVIETYSGVDYACYYLRLVEEAALSVVSGYTNVAGDLIPTAPATLNTIAVSTTVNVEVELSVQEVDNIKEAQEIIHGRPGFATISEMGLFTGVDRTIALDSSTNIQEVIACQLHSSVNVGKILDYTTSTSTVTTLSVGSLDPMYVA